MIDRHDWDQIYKLMVKADEYETFIRKLAYKEVSEEDIQSEAQSILRKP